MSDSDEYPFLVTSKEDGETQTIEVPGWDTEIPLATGIRWAKLGLTLIASLVTSWFLGLQQAVRGMVRFWIDVYPDDLTRQEYATTDPQGGVLDALTDFFATLVYELISGPVDLLASAAESTATWINSTFTGWMGVLAFPAGVALVMATLYVAARGVGVLRS